jgi:tetratricopeptide (TPR) repeat protein
MRCFTSFRVFLWVIAGSLLVASSAPWVISVPPALAWHCNCHSGLSGTTCFSPCGWEMPPSSAAPTGPTPGQLQQEREEKDLSEAALDANDKGVRAYKAGNYLDAVKFLSEALEYTPDDELIQQNLQKARVALATARVPREGPLATVPITQEPKVKPSTDNAPPSRPPTYHPTLAIPVACIALGDIGDAPCGAIGAAKLAYELRKAVLSKRLRNEVLRVLATAVGKRILALSFPSNYRMDAKIELIEELYKYERELFSYVEGRIQSEMIDDPALSRRLAQYAIADSVAVQELINSVNSEARAQANLMENTIKRAPNSTAVKFKCEVACSQFVEVAKLGWRPN